MFNKSLHKNKKESLLAQKQKLLQEIKYYEKRIEEAKLGAIQSSSVFDNDSSDSDIELPIKRDAGPSEVELKNELSMLETCLSATQELTNLEVVQSEVNVLVEDPKIDGAVVEPGVWREVNAECCIYLVWFSITFFTHTPYRSFAQTSYHKLQVTPTKLNHENELSKSILPLMTRPSDAVEVIRSYATAYSSRRATLARLVDRYPEDFNMSPMPEGGILIKCANLMEVHWTLQNTWSPVAPFQHRMKFDLEYMDGQYIKTITQAHRQLSNPGLQTDERTLLLAKIVSTCLEARGPTQELHDTLSSDPETARTLQKRRTTLDQEEEMPNVRKKKQDIEVMAPPKSLPKKAKSKENKENERVKRRAEDDDGRSLKKIKTGEEKSGNTKEIANKVTKDDDVTKSTNKNDGNDVNNEPTVVSKDKNNTVKKSSAKDAKVATKQKNTDNNEKVIVKKAKNREELDKASNDKIVKSTKTDKAIELKKSVAKSKNNEEISESVNIVINEKTDNASETKTSKTKKNKVVKATELKKSVAKSKNNEEISESVDIVSNEKTENASETKKSRAISKNNDGNTNEIAGKVASNNNEKFTKTNKALEAKSVVSAKNSEGINAKSIPKKKNENVASEKAVSKKIINKNTEAKNNVARPQTAEKNQNNKDPIATEKKPKPAKVADVNIASSKNSDNNIQNRKVATEENKQVEVITNTKGKNAVENAENPAKDKDGKKLQSKNAASVNNEQKTQTNKVVNNNKETTNNKDKVSIEGNAQKKTKSNLLTREPSETNLGHNKVKTLAASTKPVKIYKENKTTNENEKNKMSNDKLNTKTKSNVQNVDKNKQITNIKSKVINKPVISKIPQKKPSPKLKAVTKKLPIRVSPRKHISAKSPVAGPKTTVTSNLITNIPRFLPKPTVTETK